MDSQRVDRCSLTRWYVCCTATFRAVYLTFLGLGLGLLAHRDPLCRPQALAKCDFLLKSASAVSEFAIYLSPQLHNNSFDFQISGQPTPTWYTTGR